MELQTLRRNALYLMKRFQDESAGGRGPETPRAVNWKRVGYDAETMRAPVIHRGRRVEYTESGVPETLTVDSGRRRGRRAEAPMAEGWKRGECKTERDDELGNRRRESDGCGRRSANCVRVRSNRCLLGV
nr:hypothetical protein Itr_chr04CG17670 [Ipomoea trifida]